MLSKWMSEKGRRTSSLSSSAVKEKNKKRYLQMLGRCYQGGSFVQVTRGEVGALKRVVHFFFGGRDGKGRRGTSRLRRRGGVGI